MQRPKPGCIQRFPSLPQRDKGAPSRPGCSPEGKMPVAGAVERGDGNAPGRLRLATIRSCSAKDLGNFAVRSTAATAIVKTDGWSGCSAVPRDRHRPMSSATGPPLRFSPGSTPRSATSRAGLGASITGYAPSASRPVSMSSSFV